MNKSSNLLRNPRTIKAEKSASHSYKTHGRESKTGSTTTGECKSTIKINSVIKNAIYACILIYFISILSSIQTLPPFCSYV